MLSVCLPAGAGKTTLMDVLAGRKTTGRVEGQVWVDGHPKQQHTFARVCGYVEQTDIHTARVRVQLGLPALVLAACWWPCTSSMLLCYLSPSAASQHQAGRCPAYAVSTSVKHAASFHSL